MAINGMVSGLALNKDLKASLSWWGTAHDDPVVYGISPRPFSVSSYLLSWVVWKMDNGPESRLLASGHM